MVTDLKEVATENLPQTNFFKNSFLNAFIIFQLSIKDFFKYFLFQIKPFSRYEFWCFIFACITVIFVSASFLSLISFAIPVFKPVAEAVFYICVVLTAFISLRVYAGRLKNVKEYISYIDLLPSNHILFDKLKKFFLNLFFSIPLFYVAGFLKITILALYLFSNLFYSVNDIEFIDKLYSIKIIDFTVFILKAMGTVYFVFSAAPSIHRLDFLYKCDKPYYPIAKYYILYSKRYIIDYLSLLSSLFVIISVGHIFIIGYSISLHIVICISIIIQSIALILSGRFLSVIMGISSVIFIIYTNIVFIFYGFDYLFISDEAIYFTINHYQVAVSMLFLGMLYYTTYDKDIIKVLAVISFFLSVLFMFADISSFKDIFYEIHSPNILFYAFIELISIFIFLIRVAYNKGVSQPDAKYAAMVLNNFRKVIHLIKLKHIYTVLYYSAIAMLIYSLFMLSIPFVFNTSLDKLVDSNMMTILFNIRFIIAFYLYIGLFLLCKHYSDIFLMLIISAVIMGEIYILFFTPVNIILSNLRVYPLEYVYLFLYSLMFVAAVCVNQYNHYISVGFGLYFLLIIVTLIAVLFNTGFYDNMYVYKLFFFVSVVSSLFVAIGSYGQINDEKELGLEQYAEW